LRKKKAESPSSRAIPQKYYYQKRYCLYFVTIGRPVFAIFNRADISSSKISVLGCPPSIVATKGEFMKFAKYMPGRKVKIKVAYCFYLTASDKNSCVRTRFMFLKLKKAVF
jgi:hypothetical protein